MRRESVMFVGGQAVQSGHRRSLRLDTIVVVDSVMLRHHRSHDVTAYTMAIMNMVRVHRSAPRSFNVTVDVNVKLLNKSTVLEYCIHHPLIFISAKDIPFSLLCFCLSVSVCTADCLRKR